MSQHTFRQAVADYFIGNPNEWHDGMVIAQIGGCYAYRTRISECRTQLGMCIENRLRKVGKLEAETAWKKHVRPEDEEFLYEEPNHQDRHRQR